MEGLALLEILSLHAVFDSQLSLLKQNLAKTHRDRLRGRIAGGINCINGLHFGTAITRERLGP